MSYATPFYYAAKALQEDSYPAASHHQHVVKQRRRRIRLVLFPALRPHRRRATVAPAVSNDAR